MKFCFIVQANRDGDRDMLFSFYETITLNEKLNSLKREIKAFEMMKSSKTFYFHFQYTMTEELLKLGQIELIQVNLIFIFEKTNGRS
jgi:hypothetical protein